MEETIICAAHPTDLFDEGTARADIEAHPNVRRFERADEFLDRFEDAARREGEPRLSGRLAMAKRIRGANRFDKQSPGILQIADHDHGGDGRGEADPSANGGFHVVIFLPAVVSPSNLL